MPRYPGADRIPVVGPWIGRVGQIQDIMATPCEVEPEIWVLAFFAGAPAALFSLYKPDPFDAASERFGSGHKKRRRRRYRWNDMILLPKPTRPGLQWVVFRVGQWAERLGWYILVADVAVEWAYNWSSMAYQWSGCANPTASWGRLGSTRGDSHLVDGIYAGWDSTAHHGQITTDDFSIIALSQMQASPYIKLKIGMPVGGADYARFLRFQVIDLNSGWESDPMDLAPEPDKPPKEHAMVYRDYLGLGSQPRYALYIQSDGGFWSQEITLGLNGETGRGLTFDP